MAAYNNASPAITRAAPKRRAPVRAWMWVSTYHALTARGAANNATHTKTKTLLRN